MRNVPALIASLVLFGAALPAQATITVLNQWHLGEADAGASAGGAGAALTVDNVAAFNLNKLGAPTYTADVPPGIGSALALAFDGANDQYQNTAGVASTLTDNFGIEAWVKSNGNTSGNANIAYNGNTGSSGWGIYRLGANYGFLYGGVVLYGSAPISSQWTELALVRNNGTTTFYVNGAVSYTTTTGPNTPSGGVGIGGNPLTAGYEMFDGEIDEVRIFSFASNAFSVSDLNLAPPVPTPMLSLHWLALLAGTLVALGAWVSRRRSRRI